MEIPQKNEYKNRWVILAVVVLLPFMATLDSTIVNVVLPVMVNIFSVTMSSIQLIVICYLVTIVSTILFFGRLGDIKGKSIIFILGLLVFTIGSLFCGLSKSFETLVLFRIIQAIGASAAMANNQGIITQVFPAHAGTIMMISPVIITVISPFSGYLSDRIGSEFLTFLGLIIMGIGMSLMAALNEYSTIQELIICISLIAIGNGVFLSPNNSLVMPSVPSNKLGIAGSINAFVRNLGQSSGVAMATLLLYSFMSIKMGEKVLGYIEGRNDVFIFGMRYVYISAATICFIGTVITAIRLKRKKSVNS